MTDALQSAYQRAKAEYEKAADTFQQVAHDTTGIVPQVKKVVSDDVQDALPSTEELLGTIQNLYSEIQALKTQGQSAFSQLADTVTTDFAQGGDPVSHTLHLDNGTILPNFQGIATHVANADGTVNKVIAAYPTVPTASKN